MESTVYTIREFSISAREKNVSMGYIKSPVASAEFARTLYSDNINVFESFYAIFLSKSCEIIGTALISTGGVSSVVVDNRIIAHIAVKCLAASVVVVHNHPSGSLKPSDADKNLTHDLKKGLEFLGIDLLDHIILTETSYFSFAEDGIL